MRNSPALAILSLFLTANLAFAQFNPGPNPVPSGTTTGAQILPGGTGTVNSGGAINTSGAAIPVTVTGSSTLTNLGTIQQTSSGRAVLLDTDGITLTVNNGSNTNSTALIDAADADAVRVSRATDSISLNNYGKINSSNASAGGAQAVDWNSITSGSNTLTNFPTGLITASGADGVRPGMNGVVTNSGIIRATPVQSGGSASGSDGVGAQTRTGVQVTNSGTIQGRAGVTGGVATGGPAFAITVTNQTGGTISGVNGSGVNVDGVNADAVATIVNQAGATIKGTWDGVSANGDGDGIDIDGVLNLTNYGFIRALGANGVGSDTFPNGADGIAAGGGTIINETGAEITAAVTTGAATFSQGILIDNSSRGNAIAATSLTNRGLIKSDKGPAVVFISAFANTITNNATGTITGGGTGAQGAAIQTGSGNDTLNTSGTIVGDNGFAIDLQGGNNLLNIFAGSVTGNISGGTGGSNFLLFDLVTGQSFTYAGQISNFSTVEVEDGTVTLSGASTYTGNTVVTGHLIAQNVTGSATGSGAVSVNNTGILSGTGTVSAVTVNGGGTIAPGNSAGRLSINGNYAQTGTLEIELGGTTVATQYDQLAVSGSATLSGTLNLTLINGFQPAFGDTFQILTSGSATGNFTTINSPGFTVRSDVTNTGVILTVTSGAPTPTPTATATATATPSATATATPSATATATATPAPTATATATPAPTATATPVATRLANISTRLRVEAGDSALIGGFIITGTQPKKVIFRAISSSLSLPDRLTDPILELRNSDGVLLDSNDNWQESSNKQAIMDTGIAPTDSQESAILATLPANGANYTAIVRGAFGGAGIALVEAYDLDGAADSRLANISTRGLVQTGDNALIAGTIVLGQTPQKVIIRAIGLSSGLPGALKNPTLELLDGNGTQLRANDDWRTDQEAEIIATGIPPQENSESALIQTLPGDGATYTAIVRGANGGTGIGIVEIYALALPAQASATVTSPADGATVGSSFMIEAMPTSGSGAVKSVSFYDGSTLLGTDSTAPYRFAFNGAPPGTRSLTAVALDFNNQMSTSPVVNVTVTGGAGSLTRGPYLQKATPTQLTIRWRNTLYDLGRVRFGPTPVTQDQTADETTIPGPAQNDHVVTLTGLTPNTTYYYSIGSGSDTLAPATPAEGAEYTFTTPPATGTAVNTRIWVLGDAGTAGYGDAGHIASQTAVRDAFYAFTGARTPNVVLQLGDNAYNSGRDNEFQVALFDMYPSMLRKTTFWSCLGNHETAQATAFVDTYPYFDIYTLPTAGEAGGTASGTEHYYSFDYGNIHFIALDSMTASRAVDNPNTPAINEDGPMAAWLRSDLQSTTATWIIAFFHHPPYTKGSHNSDTETELIQMRQNFLPILEAGGVDMVLSGHSHIYERSFLVDGHYGFSNTLTPAMKLNAGDGRPAGSGAYTKALNGAGGHKGTVYALAGSAGQATSTQSDYPHPVNYISLLELGSLVLDVNGTRLDATFIRENSTKPDTFTIIKQ